MCNKHNLQFISLFAIFAKKKKPPSSLFTSLGLWVLKNFHIGHWPTADSNYVMKTVDRPSCRTLCGGCWRYLWRCTVYSVCSDIPPLPWQLQCQQFHIFISVKEIQTLIKKSYPYKNEQRKAMILSKVRPSLFIVFV